MARCSTPSTSIRSNRSPDPCDARLERGVVEQCGHLADQLMHELRCDPMRARLALDAFCASLRLAELDCDCVEFDRDPIGCRHRGRPERAPQVGVLPLEAADLPRRLLSIVRVGARQAARATLVPAAHALVDDRQANGLSHRDGVGLLGIGGIDRRLLLAGAADNWIGRKRTSGYRARR